MTVAANFARESRARQGLPPTVEDAATLARIAALIDVSPSTQKRGDGPEMALRPAGALRPCKSTASSVSEVRR